MFKYKKKNKKISWQNNELKVEFSCPTIQSHNEYKLIESSDDILYYYYDIKLFNKVITRNGKKKWKLIYKKFVYDFPSILEFKDLLNFFLNLNPVKDGQKILYKDDKIQYQYSLSTTGFFNVSEDFYEVKKETDSLGENPIYTLYIGGSMGIEADFNTNVLRITSLSEDEIKELLHCVEEFINFSIETKNKATKKWIREELTNKEVKNSKLYKYKKNMSSIKDFYCIGDAIEVTYYIDKEFGDTKNCKSQIKDILNSELILTNDEVIPMKNIIYLFKIVSDEELHYNQTEIANEFLSHLEDEEKEDFKNLSNKKLVKKYKSAIINRTWMYREEHNFKYKRKGKPTQDIVPIVKEVINIIKNNLNHS